MKDCLIYVIIFFLLLALELLYFKVAEKFDIVDRPNVRSSHTGIVLRGGGIIFLLGVLVWSFFFGFDYPWFLAAVTLAAGISFIDDIRSLPDSVRLIFQFIAMLLMFVQLDILHLDMWWAVIVALVVCVGATNIFNFMDGINGITGAYSFSVLLPLVIINADSHFMDQSFLYVVILSVLIFLSFNFRSKGKAKCFAGDVGSVGIAYVLLFSIGRMAVQSGDVTWIIFLLVYGVDGCLTICHRILLHEDLGAAHRKHAYQLMANELNINPMLVSCMYMLIQFAISLGFIYLCPPLSSAFGIGIKTVHWIYLAVWLLVLSASYVAFMKKYYHLHEEYLAAVAEFAKNQ